MLSLNKYLGAEGRVFCLLCSWSPPLQTSEAHLTLVQYQKCDALPPSGHAWRSSASFPAPCAQTMAMGVSFYVCVLATVKAWEEGRIFRWSLVSKHEIR